MGQTYSLDRGNARMGLKVDVLLPSGILAARSAARRLEGIGVDGVFSPESTSDPFLDLVLPAVETQIPSIGSAVAVAFPRSPFVTAVAAWRLQEASRGRFVLGLGSQVKGHIERRFGLRYEPPGPKMRDYLRAVKALWKGFRKEERLDYRGRYYTHTLLPAAFDPGPIPYPDPQIWLAAVNDYNLETIGLLADGFCAHPIGSPKYLSGMAIPAIEKGLSVSGRVRSDVQVQAVVLLVAGDDDEEREAAASYARLQIAWSASTRTYSRIMEHLGWPEVPEKLHSLMSRGDFPGMVSTITDEMLSEFAVVAGVDDAADVILERYEGVADRVLFYNLLSSSYASDEGRLREFIGALQ